MPIPLRLDAESVELVERIAVIGRSLRNLQWIASILTVSIEVQPDLVRDMFSENEAAALGLREISIGGGRFRRRAIFQPAHDTAMRISTQQIELNTALDAAVERLYAAADRLAPPAR
jgi:hypothetical protein